MLNLYSASIFNLVSVFISLFISGLKLETLSDGNKVTERHKKKTMSLTLN
jgi:hypothetical protein